MRLRSRLRKLEHVGGDPLADLGSACLVLALHGQRPPMQDRSPGLPEWKALFGRERDSGLCLLVCRRHVPRRICDTMAAQHHANARL